MDFLKKVNALVLGFGILLAVSCGKEEEPVAPATNNPASGNSTKCQLIQDREDTLTSKYTYDSQGRMQEKAFAYGRERFAYNSAGNLSEWMRLNANLDTTYKETYEYNTDNLPVKMTTWSKMAVTAPMAVWGTQVITYDSQKRVASKTNYQASQPGIITSKINYTYPANNKIEIEAWEAGHTPNTLQLHYQAQMTYDNNKTPFGESSRYNYQVNHNELSYAVQFFRPFSYSHSRTSTYTFNAAGYPTQKTSVIDGQYSMLTTYTYNCQ